MQSDLASEQQLYKAARRRVSLVFTGYELAFFSLVSAFFLQITVYKHSASQSSLVIYHFILPVCFYLLYALRGRVSVNLLWTYFTVAGASSLIASLEYGFSLKFIQFVFALMAAYCGVAFSARLTADQRKQLYIGVSVLVLAFLMIRNTIYILDIDRIYSRTPRVDGLLFMASGGRNLEATLLGLVSILVLRTGVYKYLVFVALVSSVLMQSRAGLLSAMISLAIYLFDNASLAKYLFLLLGALALAAILLVVPIDNIPVLQRLSISSDLKFYNEGQGRFALWMAAASAFMLNMNGYGIGNGIQFAEQYSGFIFREDNFHNIFIQALLDCGLAVGAVLVLVMMLILKLVIKDRTIESYFSLSCLILGMVQFTGYEPFIWFFVGVSFRDAFKKRQQEILLPDGQS